MSRTESAMVELGTLAPPFALPDVMSEQTVMSEQAVLNERIVRPQDLLHGYRRERGSLPADQTPSGGSPKRGLLVMFVCVHCPYVKHVEEQLGRLGREYFGEDGEGPIAIAAIQSNDLAAYPQDGPEFMREQARRCGWTFPYLLDETQAVARSYGAACTPDFFLFDGNQRLVYRGQLDGSRPRRGDFGNGEPVTGIDLRRALDAVIAGDRPDPDQRGSIGCNIKWRAA